MTVLGSPAASREWQTYWPMVLAAGIAFSYSAVITFSFGLFIEPLSEEFGWRRSDVAAGLSISALLSVPLAPLLGMMIDRFGSRRIAIPSMILTAACMVSFAFANGSITQWLVLWTVYAILSVGINSTVWTAAVSGVFTAGRGLALAATLSGATLGQVFAPPLTQWLIDGYGWRTAFVALGLGWATPGLLLCSFFLFDIHDKRKQARRVGEVVKDIFIPGLTLRQAARSIPLLRVAAATLIMMMLTIGVIVHQVPILTEAGVTRQEAALLASLTGIAGIIGKFVTGYLLDRMDAGLVCSLTMGVAALAFAMLLLPTLSVPLMVVAMIVLGYSSGCKFQVCAYQTARYGGLRNFGKIFGIMSSLVAMGSGFGPYLAGLTYDVAGSYTPLLIIGVPASLISGLLLFRLGPYPDWRPDQEAESDLVLV